MKLFSMIKKNCLLVVVVMSNACAMELVTYQSEADKFVREFPLMTLKRAYHRYNNCDAGVKAEIEKKIASKEDECFAGIFNAATKMPVDASMEVVKKFFNNNMKPTKKFLEMPIKDALETYAWTRDVYENKEAKKIIGSIRGFEKFVIKEMFNNGDLFQYCNEIKRIDDYASKCNRGVHYADRKLLESLNMLNKKIKCIQKELGVDVPVSGLYFGGIPYRYHDEYTWKKFLNRLKERDTFLFFYLLCVTPIITAWASRYIELNWCQKMLTDSDMQLNEEAIIFNESLKWARTQTQNINSEILPYIDFKNFKPLIEEHYSIADYLKILGPFFIPSLLPGSALATNCYENNQFPSWNDIGILFGGAGVTAVLIGLAWLRHDDFPLGSLGMFTAVSGAFFLGAVGKTLREMRRLRDSSIGVNGIDQLFKDYSHDGIVIE